ncbi:MAG: acyltransferase family protein [Heteroscytonema crispum UTEX LB 1556]
MSHTTVSGLKNKAAFYIPSLDGIRAVSFLMVFLGHVGLKGIVPGPFGVTVFFFLSGYLITTLLRIEYDRNGKVSFKQFYLKRILRILPPFYLVLVAAIALVLIGVLPGEIQLPAVASQMLHYSNYWMVQHGGDGQPLGTIVFWSLAVEEHFYVLFPWFYLCLRKINATGKQQAIALWGLCLAILLWRCVLVFAFGATEGRIYSASDTRFDSILFGCALAVYENPVLDPESRLSEKTWKCMLLPLALIILLLTFVSKSFEFEYTVRYSIQGIALYVVFICAIRYPTWSFFQILNLQWVRFLGVLSYSLYLVHYITIYAVENQLPNLAPFIQNTLALAVAIAISYGIYQLVEKPCAVWRKKLS